MKTPTQGRTGMKVTVLPGDGVGPEVTREAVKVLRVVCDLSGLDVGVTEAAVGGAAIRQCGRPLPQSTLDQCLASDAVLLGAVGGPEFDALPRPERPEAGLLDLRRALGGFANLRPSRSYKTLMSASP
ncbi:MAG: isocitrate/isopropylmalate family dehydrogenase, partial [Terriglobales bacterium]